MYDLKRKCSICGRIWLLTIINNDTGAVEIKHQTGCPTSDECVKRIFGDQEYRQNPEAAFEDARITSELSGTVH